MDKSIWYVISGIYGSSSLVLNAQCEKDLQSVGDILAKDFGGSWRFLGKRQDHGFGPLAIPGPAAAVVRLVASSCAASKSGLKRTGRKRRGSSLIHGRPSAQLHLKVA